MSDGSLKDWFEEGLRLKAKWLLIVWDAHDLDWEPQYHWTDEQPPKASGGTWHVEHIIDLSKPLDNQWASLDYMP